MSKCLNDLRNYLWESGSRVVGSEGARAVNVVVASGVATRLIYRFENSWFVVVVDSTCKFGFPTESRKNTVNDTVIPCDYDSWCLSLKDFYGLYMNRRL